ncbi:MAG: RagB/SusD family nutrient uptake outer membrane protein, partial [Bacteroidales bacterium]|nr:RagB/SusD family nutrient uptake outer membrane protein [Bacteroidales bacterium]
MIIVLLVVISCSKFDYSDDYSLQNIYSTSELEEAAIGAYAKFAGILTYGLYRNSFLCHTIPGEDIDIVGRMGKCGFENNQGYFDTYDEDGNPIRLNYGSCRYFAKSTEDITNYMNIINDSYKKLYKAIITQNLIINQYHKNLDFDNSINQIVGDIYFMRAYCYYRLARVFGEVPLILDTEVNYNISCSSFKEIYNQIESDLLTAISLLPLKKNVSTVCPNRGSAKALLAEVYLTMGG